MLEYTPNLKRHIAIAEEISKHGERQPNVIDLFCQILGGEEKFQKLFSTIGIDYREVISSLPNLFESIPDLFSDGKDKEEYDGVFVSTRELAEKVGHGFIDEEQVFHEILKNSVALFAWMELCDFPRKEALQKVLDLIYLKGEPQMFSEEEIGEILDDAFPHINRFCKNITNKVLGQPRSIFGREKEISQILDILCRQNRSNAILVGEPGTGRKSIAKGVAERVAEGRVSEILSEKTFFELDVIKLTAGASLVGIIEQRFSSLESELERFEDCVLIVDNIHQSVGSGGKEGSGDSASLLKSILANDKISCIAITTASDYKKYLEKDSSLVNFFEKIQVKEPTKAETKSIIENRLPDICEYHMVKFADQTIDVVLDLCERYIPYRRFPEKAIDFLDQLGAAAKNQHFTRPASILRLEKRIEKLIDPNIEDGSPKHQRLVKAIESYAKKYDEWEVAANSSDSIISVEKAISTFSKKFDISENQLRQTQEHTLDSLAKNLKLHIFGQDHAIDQISDILLCSKVGLRDKNKPLAKFMFVGSTSVGKTALCKKLAFYYFGDEKAVLKLDMSEFRDSHSTSGLIGSPPGYVGFDSGGRLTEFVKNTPSCVVIWDEIEKANPSIHNLLLQIMDDGYITDSQNYQVDFTNTIIILTSNSGSQAPPRTLGFGGGENNDRHINNVKQFFTPEFLARLDDTITFNPIGDEIMRQIVVKELSNTVEKLRGQKIELTIDASVEDFLSKEAKSDSSHARAIQSSIRKQLEVPLAKYILQNKPKQVNAKYEQKIVFAGI